MKDEELNPVLARKMLDEWNRIQKMKFWKHFTARLEKRRETIKNDWERMETGTEALPLFEKWVRLQGKARGLKEASKMPADLAQDCEDTIKGEKTGHTL